MTAIEERISVFDALADPTRRELIARLAREGPISITDLAADYPVTRQAITKHLDVLEGAGIVRSERSGRERRVSFSPEPLDTAARWIAEIGAEWDIRLAALLRFLTEESGED